MELLVTGIDYPELPDVYVIFICDFDPIGLGKYKYTRRQTLEENPDYPYEDGSHTIYLSTVGTNQDEVPTSLVKFLKFVGAELEHSTDDYADEFVKRLQDTVKGIKLDREMGRRYMLLEELMQDEYSAGKEEGLKEGLSKGIQQGHEAMQNAIISLLTDLAPVSDELKNTVSSIEDFGVLDALTKKAARAVSIEAFEEELRQIKF
jgi:predicted transposase/invertase (TIGR01784 family)